MSKKATDPGEVLADGLDLRTGCVIEGIEHVVQEKLFLRIFA